MAISFGLKSPLDYSVFSASGAAVLLELRAGSGPLSPHAVRIRRDHTRKDDRARVQ
jgi:hypothetical protein